MLSIRTLSLPRQFTMRWEGMAIEELKSIASEYVNEKKGYDLLFSVSRRFAQTYPRPRALFHFDKCFLHCSFSDVTTEAIEFDTYKLAIGFGLMFCYTMFMLGKLNVVEHRTYLAMTGQVYTKSKQKSLATTIDLRMGKCAIYF